MSASDTCRFYARIRGVLGDLCSDTGLQPSILAGRIARAYLPPLASNTLLVPSRLAFLQRSASGTVLRYARSYCIRSSTRRCLSMLRDTRGGNELAVPATNALQGA